MSELYAWEKALLALIRRVMNDEATPEQSPGKSSTQFEVISHKPKEAV